MNGWGKGFKNTVVRKASLNLRSGKILIAELMTWIGSGNKDNTWKSEENLHCLSLIRAFEAEKVAREKKRIAEREN